MGNVPSATGDPVFYVHHCQIDRLWASWSDRPGADYNWGTTPAQPSEATWSGRTFSFVDDSGMLVTAQSGGSISTAEMGYVYDSLVSAPTMAAAAKKAAFSGVLGAAMVGEGLAISGGHGRTTLAPSKEKLVLPLEAQPTEKAAPGSQHLLVLEDVKLKHRAAAPLHVFLNLPEGTPAEADSPYHVGHLTLFRFDTGSGLPMVDRAVGVRHSKATFAYDVSEILAKQKADGLWDGGPVTVTITTLGAEGSPAKALVTIGRILLLP